MCDNFEFNDDDDILLNLICTETLARENTTVMKRLNEETCDESDTLKKPKLDLSPEFSSLQRNKPNALKRIFPGPAGILTDGNQMEVSSQGCSTNFHDGPWKEMSKDFKVNNVPPLYDKFNIAWIEKEASKNQFADQKAPFLAAILTSLEVSDENTKKSVNITLKDATGTIQGNILYSLYEEYANDFIPGSVLVLVQFGVLSCTCDRCDNYHLTVTSKNLSIIYNETKKIVINKVEPELVLSSFLKQQKELELRARNQSLRKQNIACNSPVGGNFSLNNRNKFQTSYGNNNIKSRNIRNHSNSPYIVPSKNKTEGFSLPKFRNICRDPPEDREKPGTNRITKLFTFRKISLSKETDSSQISDPPYTRNASENTNIDNLSINNSMSNQNNRFDSLIRDLPTEIDCNSRNHPYIPKKRFTFKKIPLSDEMQTSLLTSESIGPNHPSTCNTNCISNNETCSIKIAGNQISVKVDNAEHEKLWKDVLDDVDISSLFEDDF